MRKFTKRASFHFERTRSSKTNKPLPAPPTILQLLHLNLLHLSRSVTCTPTHHPTRSLVILFTMANSQTTQLLGVAAVGFISGYLFGRFVDGLSTGSRPKRPSRSASSSSHPSDSDVSTESYTDTESDDEIDIDSTPLNEIPGEVRMTLVVRQDLKMGKGKAAAQCSHATLALYKKITDPHSPAYNPEMVSRWEHGNGQAKITLQVPDQDGMDLLFAQAMSLGVNAYVVHDAGRTQIAAGSATVLGLGPAPKSVIDQITHDLKLY